MEKKKKRKQRSIYGKIFIVLLILLSLVNDPENPKYDQDAYTEDHTNKKKKEKRKCLNS